MSRTSRVHPQESMLLVIDLQTKLLPSILDHEQIVATAGTLVRAARQFDIPVMATVQYVKGLGPMIAPITAALAEGGIESLEKMAFSVCGDDACRQRIETINRPQVILAGIEGHVCVQQTALDLLAMNKSVFVCADAVSSRYDMDLDMALTRMQQAGAVLTTCESILFEWCRLSGTPQFKRVLELVKSLDAARK